MARRRNLSGAFSGVQQIINAAIQQKLAGQEREKQAQADYARQLERDRIQSEQGRSNILLNQLPSSPGVARRLQSGGINEIGGVPLSAFIPSDTDIASSLESEIAKTSDYGDLMSPFVALNRYMDQGGSLPTTEGDNPLGRLMETLDSRRQQLQTGRTEAANAVPRYDPSTRARVFTPPGTDKPLQEGPTPVEAGQNEALKTIFSNSDDAIQAQVDAANRLESGTRAGAVARAGDIAQAQARARAENPTAASSRAGSAQSAAGMLERFTQLSSMINTSVEGGFDAWSNGMKRWAGAKARTDFDAQQYEALRGALGLALAAIANQGRPSDKDQTAMTNVLPGFTDPKPVAQGLIRAATQILEASGAKGLSIEEIISAAENGQLKPLMSFSEMKALLEGIRNGAPGGGVPNEPISSADYLAGKGGGGF